MRIHADGGPDTTSKDDQRSTRIGRLIRRLKIDELPQLISVFKGDMSLVGPRPEVQRYVDLYTDSQKAILRLRPGITDWASIKFHDEGEIVAKSGYGDPDQAYLELIRPEKLRLQLRHVQERNFWVDLKIVLQTVATLIRAQPAG
jgi:lipopolysaccharide/colanic/teichoic acid biosynthesis glycosyltransferase